MLQMDICLEWNIIIVMQLDSYSVVNLQTSLIFLHKVLLLAFTKYTKQAVGRLKRSVKRRSTPHDEV